MRPARIPMFVTESNPDSGSMTRPFSTTTSYVVAPRQAGRNIKTASEMMRRAIMCSLVQCLERKRCSLGESRPRKMRTQLSVG